MCNGLKLSTGSRGTCQSWIPFVERYNDIDVLIRLKIILQAVMIIVVVEKILDLLYTKKGNKS